MAIELAYNYRAKNASNKIITGIVFAQNKALGFAKLAKNGVEPIELKLNYVESLKNYFHKEFDPKELSRFYSTLGRRLNNGRSMLEGLEASVEFVRDNRLKMSIMAMRQKLADGRQPHEAMADAGFPPLDTLAMRSAAQGAKFGDQFLSLAKEIDRTTSLRRNIQQIFRMPLIMAGIMYLFFYAALIKIAPMTMKFLKSTNLKLNLTSFNQKYFEFAQFFNDHFWISSIVYWSLPVLLYFFAKSEYAKTLTNKIPSVRNISMRADMASLWTSFAILYSANAPVKEACRVVGMAAKREDSKKAFNEMAALLNTGLDIAQSAAKASFPEEIQKAVQASASSGKLVDGLNDMTKNLEEDVTVLTSFLQENMKLISLLLVGGGVAFVFMVTYYPIVSSVLSNI